MLNERHVSASVKILLFKLKESKFDIVSPLLSVFEFLVDVAGVVGEEGGEEEKEEGKEGGGREEENERKERKQRKK